MIWFDRIFSIGAFVGLLVFVYVLMKFVAEPNLWVVILVVIAITVYFLGRELRKGGAGEK